MGSLWGDLIRSMAWYELLFLRISLAAMLSIDIRRARDEPDWEFVVKIKLRDDGDVYQCSKKETNYINIVTHWGSKEFDFSCFPMSSADLDFGLDRWFILANRMIANWSKQETEELIVYLCFLVTIISTCLDQPAQGMWKCGIELSLQAQATSAPSRPQSHEKTERSKPRHVQTIRSVPLTCGLVKNGKWLFL